MSAQMAGMSAGTPLLPGVSPRVDRAPRDQVGVDGPARRRAARACAPGSRAAYGCRTASARPSVRIHELPDANARAPGPPAAAAAPGGRNSQCTRSRPARVAPPHAHLHRRDVVGPGQELEEDVVPATVVKRAVHVVSSTAPAAGSDRPGAPGRPRPRGGRRRHRRQRAPPQFVKLRHGPTLSPASGSRQAPCGCGSPPCDASLPQSQLPARPHASAGTARLRSASAPDPC